MSSRNINHDESRKTLGSYLPETQRRAANIVVVHGERQRISLRNTKAPLTHCSRHSTAHPSDQKRNKNKINPV